MMNRSVMQRQMFRKGGAAFPDLSGDGKITQKDILMGRGVIPTPKQYGGAVGMQQGGVAPPMMPPPAPAMMPPPPPMPPDPAMMPPPPQMDNLDPAVLEGMMGAAAEGIQSLDQAQDYEQVMNTIRGDEASIGERRDELASVVGERDADQTPESVLTLVQPVMQMAQSGVDLGIGALAQDQMAGDVQGPMAEGIMSTVDMGMEEAPPVNFNQGGPVLPMKNGGEIKYMSQGGLGGRLGDIFREKQALYESVAGTDPQALQDQKNMTQAQMLFDIANTALAFASPMPNEPMGLSGAERLALAAQGTQLFDKIGTRGQQLEAFKQAQEKDRRALSLGALQAAESQLATEKAAAAKASKTAKEDKYEGTLEDGKKVYGTFEEILTLNPTQINKIGTAEQTESFYKGFTPDGDLIVGPDPTYVRDKGATDVVKLTGQVNPFSLAKYKAELENNKIELKNKLKSEFFEKQFESEKEKELEFANLKNDFTKELALLKISENRKDKEDAQAFELEFALKKHELDKEKIKINFKEKINLRLKEFGFDEKLAERKFVNDKELEALKQQGRNEKLEKEIEARAKLEKAKLDLATEKENNLEAQRAINNEIARNNQELAFAKFQHDKRLKEYDMAQGLRKEELEREVFDLKTRVEEAAMKNAEANLRLNTEKLALKEREVIIKEEAAKVDNIFSSSNLGSSMNLLSNDDLRIRYEKGLTDQTENNQINFALKILSKRTIIELTDGTKKETVPIGIPSIWKESIRKRANLGAQNFSLGGGVEAPVEEETVEVSQNFSVDPDILNIIKEPSPEEISEMDTPEFKRKLFSREGGLNKESKEFKKIPLNIIDPSIRYPRATGLGEALNRLKYFGQEVTRELFGTQPLGEEGMELAKADKDIDNIREAILNTIFNFADNRILRATQDAIRANASQLYPGLTKSDEKALSTLEALSGLLEKSFEDHAQLDPQYTPGAKGLIGPKTIQKVRKTMPELLSLLREVDTLKDSYETYLNELRTSPRSGRNVNEIKNIIQQLQKEDKDE